MTNRISTLKRFPVMAAAGAVQDDNGPAQIVRLVEQVHAGVERNQRTSAERFAALEQANEELRAQLAASRAGGGIGDVAGGSIVRAKAALADWARGKVGVQAAHSIDSSPDGGFLVPDVLDSQIGQLLRNGNPMRALGRVVNVGAGTYSKLMNVGGATASWRGERSAVTETNGTQWAQVTPPVGELTAMPTVTQWLLDDSAFDLASELLADLASLFAEKEDAAFIDGDGRDKPWGILQRPTATTSDATRPWGTVQKIKTGNGSTLGSDPYAVLVNTVYALAAGYRANASWIVNSSTAGALMLLRDANDRPLWIDGLTQGQPPRLLGYPVFISESMNSVGSAAYPIAFGDWQRAYTIVDKGGTRVLRDPFTNKPNVNFFTTRRVAGMPIDSRAYKLIKCEA